VAAVTYLEAIRQGIWEEMERDSSVFVLGEDVGHLWRRLQGDGRPARSALAKTVWSIRRFPNRPLSAPPLALH
jgi:pyruvate/2-oxoglutarate/acetoin dehydrogenase E1 component